MKTSRNIALAGLLVMATCLLAVSPSWGQPFISNPIWFDNFNDNSLSLYDPGPPETGLWEWGASSGGGTPPTILETSHRLEMTIPPTSYPSSFGLGLGAGPAPFMDILRQQSPDFDLKVDFNLLAWPNYNGMSAGIRIFADDYGSCGVLRASYPPGSPYGGQRESYLLFFELPSGQEGQYHEIFASDLTGKLRMKRTSIDATNDKVEGFYEKDGVWQLIGAVTVPRGLWELSIGINSNQNLDPSQPYGKTVQVGFDNFLASITPAGAVTASILDYYFTKVGAWGKYSYTKPPGFDGFTLTLSQVASGEYAGKYRIGDYHTPDYGTATWRIFDWSADRSAVNIYTDSLKVYSPPAQMAAVNPEGTLITTPFDTNSHWYFKTQASYGVPAGTFNNVLVWVVVDENFGSNSVNTELGLTLPFGVTGVTWYAPGVGEIANKDVDAATGNTAFYYELTRYGSSPPKALTGPLMLLLLD
jgi:hypothetical protein